MKKRILFILLPLCICLSGCDTTDSIEQQEYNSNTEIELLKPDIVEKKEVIDNSITEEVTTEDISSSVSNEAVTNSNDIVVDVQEEIIEESSTFNLNDTISENTQELTAEELLSAVKLNNYNNYTLYFIVESNGDVIDDSRVTKIDGDYRYDVQSMFGIRAHTFYDLVNRKSADVIEGMSNPDNEINLSSKYNHNVEDNTLKSILDKASNPSMLEIDDEFYTLRVTIADHWWVGLGHRMVPMDMVFHIDKDNLHLYHILCIIPEEELEESFYENILMYMIVVNYNETVVDIPKTVGDLLDSVDGMFEQDIEQLDSAVMSDIDVTSGVDLSGEQVLDFTQDAKDQYDSRTYYED